MAWLCGSILWGASACFVDVTDDTGGDDPGSSSVGPSTTGDDAPTTDPSGTPTSEGATSMDPPGSTSNPGTATDPPGTSDVTGSDDTSSVEPGGGTIDLTLDGCEVDFGGTVIVNYNGSLGVASVYDGGGMLSGSLQFELDGPGVMELSTQHRIDTGNVINMVEISQGTWTNLDAESLMGGIDAIGGTLVINTWEPASGESELEFQDVSLLNVVDGNVCTINGTIVTTELYP